MSDNETTQTWQPTSLPTVIPTIMTTTTTTIQIRTTDITTFATTSSVTTTITTQPNELITKKGETVITFTYHNSINSKITQSQVLTFLFEAVKRQLTLSLSLSLSLPNNNNYKN